MVAEGVNTSVVAHELMQQHGIDAPLFEEVHRVVHRRDDPSVALERLMRIAPHADVR
jgi:glycerol-3-phosphate dehydrogenase